MKLVVHLSDPHFGTENPAIVKALAAELDGTTGDVPSLIVISGDLTQRAKEEQYKAARAWLDGLPAPYVVVSGNHDVPLYDLWDRFVHPLERYRKHISADPMPTYVDDELAVVGIHTAHGFTFKDGRITMPQALAAASFLAAQGDRFKILVAHHPFVLPAGRPARDRVDGADEALPILQDAGVTMICTGHLHVTHSTDIGGFRDETREIVAVHAGTCLSTRLRGEANSYNRLVLDGDELTIRQRTWAHHGFIDGAHKTYRRTDGRWRHAPDAVTAVA
jgi:predicted phosphodiesterase